MVSIYSVGWKATQWKHQSCSLKFEDGRQAVENSSMYICTNTIEFNWKANPKDTFELDDLTDTIKVPWRHCGAGFVVMILYFWQEKPQPSQWFLITMLCTAWHHFNHKHPQGIVFLDSWIMAFCIIPIISWLNASKFFSQQSLLCSFNLIQVFALLSIYLCISTSYITAVIGISESFFD